MPKEPHALAARGPCRHEGANQCKLGIARSSGFAGVIGRVQSSKRRQSRLCWVVSFSDDRLELTNMIPGPTRYLAYTAAGNTLAWKRRANACRGNRLHSW
jgi:hypothetical protein